MASGQPEDWDRDESNLWGAIAGEREDDFHNDLADDRRAMALFDAGWIDQELSREDRSAARDAFMDYMIEEGYFDNVDDFDWEAWREYMGY